MSEDSLGNCGCRSRCKVGDKWREGRYGASGERGQQDLCVGGVDSMATLGMDNSACLCGGTKAGVCSSVAGIG